jgi:hypothetical protein
VVRTSLWPSICCIWRMSSFACNRCVANMCRLCRFPDDADENGRLPVTQEHEGR